MTPTSSKTLSDLSKQNKTISEPCLITVTLNTALDVVVPLRRLAPAAVHRLDWPFRLSAGGKGLNVARAIRCLGGRPQALCVLAGTVGRLIQDLLIEEKMPVEAFWLPGQRSRMSVFITETRRGKTTRVMEPGPVFEKEQPQRLMMFLDRHVSRGGVVIFSGRLPPGLPDDFYARCVRHYQNRERPVVVDTSGPALKKALESRPFMIKPNLSEAQEILEERLETTRSQVAAMRRLVRCGVPIVWLTLGRGGAWVGTRQGLWRVYAPRRVSTAHPVGCGDALIAGFWVARQSGWSWEDQLRFAVACGSNAAGFETPGRLDPREVETEATKIRIKQWDGAWRV